MHLRLESQPEVSYFFHSFFALLTTFLQLDYMYVDCDGDIAINTNSLTNRGLEMRASRVLGKFFFLYYFTNNFLLLDTVYMNCEGNDECTTTYPNTWRNSGA